MTQTAADICRERPSLLFLDVDGVLNDHSKLPSGYCGIDRNCVAHLNSILAAVPDVMLVISSSWRYQVLMGAMTLKGFETLLLVHGVRSHSRLHGVTDIDPNDKDLDSVEAWCIYGLQWRAKQINDYVSRHNPRSWSVLDDLPLDLPGLVQTDGSTGMTAENARQVIELLDRLPWEVPDDAA